MKIYDNENDNNYLSVCKSLNNVKPSNSHVQPNKQNQNFDKSASKSKENKLVENGGESKIKTTPQVEIQIIMSTTTTGSPNKLMVENQVDDSDHKSFDNFERTDNERLRRGSRFGGSLKISDFPPESTEMSVVTCLATEVGPEILFDKSQPEPEPEPSELLVISTVGVVVAASGDIIENNLLPIPGDCEISTIPDGPKKKGKQALWLNARLNRHCSEDKSSREKKLWCSVAVLLVLATGLLISLVLLALNPKEDEHSEICLSPECVITAERVLNSMDATIDPCEDFFKYSCGGWVSKNPIPDASSNWDQFDVLREKMNQGIRSILEKEPIPTDPQPVLLAQKFYQMCTSEDNKDNHTELKELAEMMADGRISGSGSALDLNSIPEEDLGVTIGRIRRELNGNYLLTIYVFFDEKRPTQNTIYIDQPTFGVAVPHFLDANENKFVVAYEQLITDIWPYVFESENEGRNSSEIAAEVIGFERQLAQIVTRMEKRRNRTSLYNPMTMKALVELMPPEINWTEYFKQVFMDTSLDIDWDNVTIIVKDVSYFEAMGSVLSNTTNTVIRNYLKWRIIFQYANAVSVKFQQRLFEYLKVTSGIQYPPPKWKHCSEWVNRNLGWAVSYRYVRQSSFKRNFKNEVTSIVKDIRDGFYDILKESDWIGNETKKIAYGKAQAMQSFVAYPEWLIEDREALNSEFKGLLPQKFDKNHFNNFLKVSKWANQKSLMELGKEKDYSKWISYSTVVNAFYSASYNAIAFPAGILQIPFYGFPLQSMNYGGIGAVIGHEITHAFDDEGAQSDAKGRLINWWDESTLSKYQAKARCFVYQYGNFSVPELNTTLNGINTQGENIADNGGLRQAFRGYQAYVKRYGEEKKLPGLNFTPNQLFFVAFAQSLCGSYRLENLQQQILTSRHSPWKFQVQGSVANSQDFAMTWKCPIPMEPCQIW